MASRRAPGAAAARPASRNSRAKSGNRSRAFWTTVLFAFHTTGEGLRKFTVPPSRQSARERPAGLCAFTLEIGREILARRPDQLERDIAVARPRCQMHQLLQALSYFFRPASWKKLMK